MKKFFTMQFVSLAVVGLMFTGCASRGKTAKVPVNKPVVACPTSQASAPDSVQAAIPPKAVVVNPTTGSGVTLNSHVVIPGVPKADNVNSEAVVKIVVGKPGDDNYSVLFMNRSGKLATVMLNHGLSGKFEIQDKKNQVVEVDRTNKDLIYLVSNPDGDSSDMIDFGRGPRQEVTIAPKKP